MDNLTILVTACATAFDLIPYIIPLVVELFIYRAWRSPTTRRTHGPDYND